MKHFLFLISIASLTSCVVLTDISHSYDHYGNDVFMNKRDFYYVKQYGEGQLLPILSWSKLDLTNKRFIVSIDEKTQEILSLSL